MSNRLTPRIAFLTVVGLAAVGLIVGLMDPTVDMAVAILLLPPAIALGIRRPEWILVAFLYAGAFKAVIPIPFDLTVALAAAVLFLSALDLSRRGFPEMNVGAWLFVAVVFFVVVGLFWGGVTPYGLVKASRVATLGMVAFFGAAILLRGEREVEEFANGAMFIGLLMSVYAVATEGTPDLYGRFTAFGSNTIALGRAAAITLSVAVVRLFWNPKVWWWAVPTAAVAMWALGGSGSRGPAVAVVLALGGIAAYRLFRRGVNRLAVVGTIAGVAGLGVVLWQTLPEASVVRFANALGGTFGASILSRVEIASLSFGLIEANPVTGVGTGQFATYSSVHPYPHNMLLELASENGVGVALLMIAVLGIALARAFRWAKEQPGFPSDFVLVALIASITGALVSGDLNDNRFLFSVIAVALFSAWGSDGASDAEGGAEG